MSNPIYNVVTVVPNKFKSNPVNPTHELGFLKPKCSKVRSQRPKEENVPTVLSSTSKGFQNDKTHKVSDFILSQSEWTQLNAYLKGSVACIFKIPQKWQI